ncbi:hypothetical protein BKA69DRAFT_1041485 [Paraphysoderma sedebokerense]|nr:hypothetical protein BKA69DRAFT_1041485 [Paraphysoderma sedebokerense]
MFPQTQQSESVVPVSSLPLPPQQPRLQHWSQRRRNPFQIKHSVPKNSSLNLKQYLQSVKSTCGSELPTRCHSENKYPVLNSSAAGLKGNSPITVYNDRNFEFKTYKLDASTNEKQQNACLQNKTKKVRFGPIKVHHYRDNPEPLQVSTNAITCHTDSSTNSTSSWPEPLEYQNSYSSLHDVFQEESLTQPSSIPSSSTFAEQPLTLKNYFFQNGK